MLFRRMQENIFGDSTFSSKLSFWWHEFLSLISLQVAPGIATKGSFTIQVQKSQTPQFSRLFISSLGC